MKEEYDEGEVGDGHDSDEVETADEAELAENDVSSGIGAADNKLEDEAGDSSKVKTSSFLTVEIRSEMPALRPAFRKHFWMIVSSLVSGSFDFGVVGI